MTDERTPERDQRPDPERAKDRPDEERRPAPGGTDEDPNPWTREGPDAPDAADIEEPDEQR
jgi:hypothetical protein